VIVFVTNTKPDSMEWLSAEDAAMLGLEVKQLDEPPAHAAPSGLPEQELNAPVPKFAERPESNAPSNPDANHPEMPTSQTLRQWALLGHTDLADGDLPGMPLDASDTHACQARCEAIASCTAFTFNEAYHACFLKRSVTTALQYSGAVSGYDLNRNTVTRIGRDPGDKTGFRTSKGLEILARPYRSYRNATLGWCQDRCLAARRCVGFNFYPDGECRFLRAKKPIGRNPAVTSGGKLD
jgi:hypothetical protein